MRQACVPPRAIPNRPRQTRDKPPRPRVSSAPAVAARTPLPTSVSHTRNFASSIGLSKFPPRSDKVLGSITAHASPNSDLPGRAATAGAPHGCGHRAWPPSATQATHGVQRDPGSNDQPLSVRLPCWPEQMTLVAPLLTGTQTFAAPAFPFTG